MAAPVDDSLAGARTFRCVGCGFAITLRESDASPICPRCGTGDFEHASMFSERWAHDLGAAPTALCRRWVRDARQALRRRGPYLVYDAGSTIRAVAIPPGFARIGRSLRADLRLGDPTVARRHALLHRHGASVNVLDDHSLNGVFVNGERVDWRRLQDGDEIDLGRFRLYFVAVRPLVGDWPVATAPRDESSTAAYA